MDIVFLIGRILFGGYFLMGGINHFTKMGMMTGYATSKNVPMPKVSVALTGIVLALGGLGILLGVQILASVVLLTAFLVVASFKMHRFWGMEEGEAKMHEMRYFMVNLALAGATLMLLGITEWPMSL